MAAVDTWFPTPHSAHMEFARIRDETGYEPGLTYQVSANLDYFPSLIWTDPFAGLLFPALRRAEPRFDAYGVHEIGSASWIDVARSAEETEDRLRAGRSIPADILLMAGGEVGRMISSTGGRRRATEGLQLTSRWLVEAAAHHPTLTFYGV